MLSFAIMRKRHLWLWVVMFLESITVIELDAAVSPPTIDFKKAIEADKNISATISLPSLPSEIYGDCRRDIIAGDLKMRKSFKLNTQHQPSSEYHITEHFNQSGLYGYEARCELRYRKDDAFVQDVVSFQHVTVHDNLRRLKDISILERKNCRSTELPVTLEHGFVYLVTYHLFLDDNSYLHVAHAYNYSKDILAGRESFKVPIELPWLKALGPGRHKVNLLLENAVSVKTLTFNLDICEELSSIQILPIPYIDASPSNFTVTVRIPEGSPASIRVVLKNKQDNKEATSATTFCNNPQECKEVSVQMSAPSEGEFVVIATANNSLNTVSKELLSVKSFPLVQNVFTTSSYPISTAAKGKFFVFYKIPSDSGTFVIQLNIVGRFRLTEQISSDESVSHTSFEDAENTLSDLRFPFNPISYKVYSYSHPFRNSGKLRIEGKVTTGNGKQSMMWKINITVLSSSTTTCLRGVKIQDGGNRNILTESFDGTAILILTAVVNADCTTSGGKGVKYKWKMYKAESLDAPPDMTKEIPLSNVRTDTPEINIDPRGIVPGLYVLEVMVTYVNLNNRQKLQVVDFVSMKTPKFNMDVQICGASPMEIGESLHSQ